MFALRTGYLAQVVALLNTCDDSDGIELTSSYLDMDILGNFDQN